MAEARANWSYYQVLPSQDNPNVNWSDLIRRICTLSTPSELMYTLDATEKAGFSSISDLHFFKEDIKPMWEDPRNSNGGRCIMEIPAALSSRISEFWNATVAFCFAGVFDSITGCVCSEKSTFRISIWVGSQDEVDEIIKAWKSLVDQSACTCIFAPYNKMGDQSKFKRKTHRMQGRSKY